LKRRDPSPDARQEKDAMTTPEKTDAKHMTGASGQRWEPADEGVIVEAPNQPPPGGDEPPHRDSDDPKPIPPGENRGPEEGPRQP
jgi:hypothetical protein